MALNAQGISRRYKRKSGGDQWFDAVKTTDLVLDKGTLTVLKGRSGSGKTTLLHMLAGLLKPTEGRVMLDGTDLYALDDRALSRFRNERIGVVPQARSALDTLTVRENILLPRTLYGRAAEEKKAEEWMDALGILSLADARTGELSGGELRRMAIARALFSDPEVILADEPTGDLDDENTALVLSLFREAAEKGKTVMIVSHDSETPGYADRVFRMDAGTVTGA